MFYDPRISNPPAEFSHDPFPALVGPRPIAWVSSVGRAGHVNLAPYSHFNIVAIDPPMVMFAPSTKDDRGTPKDTLRNVTEVPEFVVNIVSFDQRELMNLTSKIHDYGINEFEAAGVETAASINVRPPRVAQCRAALECRVWKIVKLPKGPLNRPASIVIGEVVGIHVDPSIVSAGRVQAGLLRQVARLGYLEYSSVLDTFEMPRP
jgi:flavin reductase (DIM6/NTAB) family NADH-FMN oxidoreductase RutF